MKVILGFIPLLDCASLVVAAERGFDYYLMESFDQPYKEPIEGRAGAYWGVFGADRQPKFALTGTVVEDPNWPWKAALASLLALAPMFWFARHFMRFKAFGLLFFCMLIQLSASLLVWSSTLPYASFSVSVTLNVSPACTAAGAVMNMFVALPAVTWMTMAAR